MLGAYGAPASQQAQNAATANLLGGGAAGAASAVQAQQAATANLLGGAPGYYAPQTATANPIGSPPAGGSFTAQQMATQNLLQSPPPAAPTISTGLSAQQAAAQYPYGIPAMPAALDVTAGQLTPLGAAPGSSALSQAQQQQATANLLGVGAASAPATNLPGAGVATGAHAAAYQDATTNLLLAPAAAPAAATNFAAQMQATRGLLGTQAPDALQGQEAASRLLSAVETAQNRIDSSIARSITADGLRQRGTSNVDRGLTLHTKRAAERADSEITRFGLVLNGEIQSAQLGSAGRGPLMCVFSFQHGPDWTIVSGAPNGITQLATSSLPPAMGLSSAILRGGNPREVVWNFPIGLALKSTSPFGWPRIIVTVYGTDLCNRRVIKGYGSVHVPCQPGRHTRTIRLYCPISASPLTRLLGALFGNPAQLVDPRLVAGPEGREVVRVQSGGKVTVTFDVLLKDTDPFNYTF